MKILRRFIPTFLKYPLITVYISWKLLRRGKSGNRVILNLAGALPPKNSSKIIHGGKPKLLPLRERFGDTWKHFTIAYFASSGLPFAPGIWLKLYKKAGVKVVWNQNGVAYPAWAGEKTARINALMKPIYQADYVIYQTAFTKKCADKFLGPYRGPSTIIVNPVDTNKFVPRKTPLPMEPFVILMSGHHFESEERLKVSLEAVRGIPNTKLLIIGNRQDVPQEDWIETVGQFSQSEAPALYQRAHLFLHLKSLDPCPTMVLEALAAGLPVVGLKNGGMPELVSDASGILVEAPEDFDRFHYPKPEEVRSAILKIKERLTDYSREARLQAMKFDKEKWLRRHEEIFNKLLS